MKRFNYNPTALERASVPLAGLAGSLRAPLAAIGAALVVVAATGSIEARRVAGLDEQLAAVHGRVLAAAGDARRAERLSAGVARLRSVAGRVAAGRRSVYAATNAIAEIGNRLPPQTWLTSVGASATGTWTIGGRSTRVDEIGTMLRRVQDLDRSGKARLVSIAAAGRSRRVLDFVIGWDRPQ